MFIRFAFRIKISRSSYAKWKHFQGSEMLSISNLVIYFMYFLLNLNRWIVDTYARSRQTSNNYNYFKTESICTPYGRIYIKEVLFEYFSFVFNPQTRFYSTQNGPIKSKRILCMGLLFRFGFYFILCFIPQNNNTSEESSFCYFSLRIASNVVYSKLSFLCFIS